MPDFDSAPTLTVPRVWPDGIPRVRVLGVDLAQVDRARLAAYSIDALESQQPTLLFAMHLVGINILGQDAAYSAALAAANLVHADGTSVMLAVRAAGHRLPERVATQDFMYDTIAHCASHGHAVYLLGSSAGVAVSTGQELARRYPGLRIAGVRDGFFDDADGSLVAADIKASGADLLLIGMGCPREQIWAHEHAGATGARLIMTVGGTFGYIVGDERRAPRVIQKIGMEWAWRMMQDPGRLAKRYLGGIPQLTRQILRARRESES